MKKSAYVFHELDKSMGEGGRLSAQAQAFVELELPGLLSKIPPDAKVADFGCGTGVISSALARQLPGGQVVGLDPDERALELARKNGARLGNLSFERFGFGDEGASVAGPFDVVFARLVLMHMPDPAAALSTMARCLKRGGLLYAVDCDDDYNYFFPQEPWQGELLALMKRAQAMRGGTRTLGSKLLGMLAGRGLRPLGSQVLYYSTQNLGLERWKEIFAPENGGMAGQDLQFLSERGLLDAGAWSALRGKMRDFLGGPEMRAQISTWHVWAEKA